MSFRISFRTRVSVKQIKLVREIMVRPTERRKVLRIIRSTLRNWNHMMNFNVAFLGTPRTVRVNMSALPAISGVHRMLLRGG